jgi:glutamyl-tRNA reductase
LLRTAAGLASPVLGEPEILGRLRQPTTARCAPEPAVPCSIACWCTPYVSADARESRHRRAGRDGLGDALSQASDDDPALQRVLERAVTHVLHNPTRRLRAAAVSGDGDRYADLVRELFGLGDDASAPGLPLSVTGFPVRDAGTGSVTL